MLWGIKGLSDDRTGSGQIHQHPGVPNGPAGSDRFSSGWVGRFTDLRALLGGIVPGAAHGDSSNNEGTDDQEHAPTPCLAAPGSSFFRTIRPA